MKNKIENIFKNQFIRNVSTLMIGTIVSQGIVILASPLLSRLFSVKDFGNLSIFTSVTVFFAVLSTGRYELAIGLPEKDIKSLKIIKLIIYLGLVISSLYLLLILLLKYILNFNDSFGFLQLNEVLLAPLYIFFIAVYTALSYWNQRKKNYKSISVANALQVILTTLLSLLFGFFSFNSGMILSLVIGVFVASLYLLIKEKQLLKKIFFQKNIRNVAKEFSSFPRFMTLSDLSIAASQQFIPLLFAVFYNTTVVGLFSMANRMLRLPNIVITGSIANVFRNDAIEEIRIKGNCEELYITTRKKLFLLSFPIYLILFLFSPTLFELIFGPEWYEAGLYARIISVFLLVEFVSQPLNSLFYIRNKQKYLMKIQLLSAFIGGFSLYLGYYFFGSPYYSLILFAISSIIFNLYTLIITKHLANVH